MKQLALGVLCKSYSEKCFKISGKTYVMNFPFVFHYFYKKYSSIVDVFPYFLQHFSEKLYY